MRYCEDEGCPHHGMVHVCIAPETDKRLFQPSGVMCSCGEEMDVGEFEAGGVCTSCHFAQESGAD